MVDTAIDKYKQFTGLDQVKPVKGDTRIANYGDPASLLDRSAERYEHPNPFSYLSGGGPHDYHEGIARFTSGFNKPSTERPGGPDPNYRNPFNLATRFTQQTPKMQNFTTSPEAPTTTQDATTSTTA